MNQHLGSDFIFHMQFPLSVRGILPLDFKKNLSFLLIFFFFVVSVIGADRPNIILIITDDQGYGDIGAHGNKIIKTPNLDNLHSESVRLTNYHVDPTCSPTRSALMTGRYSTRTGVWHTIMGRSIMATDEVTVAEILRDNGYNTAMFGKWHLGDNAPARPHDQGFEYALYHGGGGVWQTPDYYGNDYFDDTYFENGKPKKFTGYCTDVWFDEARKYIQEKNQEKDPFFVYISTNAPHGPFWVDEKYSQPYKDLGVASPMSEFYGMITNIDENIGKLRRDLNDLGIDDNTLLIFTTDNGTAAGISRNKSENAWNGFNDGMRGQKGSAYDGGHRVPFFVHWPDNGLSTGRDIEQLTAHIDVLPTLISAAGIKGFDSPNSIDGRNLMPLMRGAKIKLSRTLFVHSQRIDHPVKWKTSSVMTDRWRLINGLELYDIVADPGQMSDVSGANGEVVAKLRGAYDKWWDSINTRFEEYVRIKIGSSAENPSLITAHDWHPVKINGKFSGVPWNQNHIKNQPFFNGYWEIEVASKGRYEFILRQKPAQTNFIMSANRAEIKIGGKTMTSEVILGADGVRFLVDLDAGPTSLITKLTDANGKSRGAFFIEVRKL